MFAVQQPVRVRESIGRLEDARPDDAPDRVVDGVAGERGRDSSPIATGV